MKYWYLLFMGLFSLLNAELIWRADLPQPFEMNIQLSSQQLTLDNSLTLEAHFRYPSSYQLVTDSLLDSLIKSANPLNPQWRLDQSAISLLPPKDNLETQHVTIHLRPLTLGFLDISLLRISFQPKDSKNTRLDLWTPIFSIEVLPPMTQTNSMPFAPLIPLEPQFPLDLTQANRQLLIDNPQRFEAQKKYIQDYLQSHTFPWLTLLILLGVGGLGWAAYLTKEHWLIGKVKSTRTLSAKQHIIQAFATLQKRQLLEQGLVQNYYSELSTILVQSLQSFVGWKKKEMTSKEILQRLENSSVLSLTQKQKITAFLTEIDEIKFAGKQPALKTAQHLYQEMQNFIYNELLIH